MTCPIHTLTVRADALQDALDILKGEPDLHAQLGNLRAEDLLQGEINGLRYAARLIEEERGAVKAQLTMTDEEWQGFLRLDTRTAASEQCDVVEAPESPLPLLEEPRDDRRAFWHGKQPPHPDRQACLDIMRTFSPGKLNATRKMLNQQFGANRQSEVSDNDLPRLKKELEAIQSTPATAPPEPKPGRGPNQKERVLAAYNGGLKTAEEIAEATGIGVGSVNACFSALRREGVIADEQRAAVLDAYRAGHTTPGAIHQATGLKLGTIRRYLVLLREEGAIERAAPADNGDPSGGVPFSDRKEDAATPDDGDSPPPKLTDKDRVYQSYRRGHTTPVAIREDIGVPVLTASRHLEELREEGLIPSDVVQPPATVDDEVHIEKVMEASAKASDGELIGKAIDAPPRRKPSGGRNENLDKAIAKLGVRVEITQLPRTGEEVFWLDGKIVPITRIMEAAGMVRG
ncbi:MAG: hypothetical protein AB7F35_00775 [Acetobacteraceae bacterium]